MVSDIITISVSVIVNNNLSEKLRYSNKTIRQQSVEIFLNLCAYTPLDTAEVQVHSPHT